MKLQLEDQVVAPPAVAFQQCCAGGQIAQRRGERRGLLGALARQEIERGNLLAFIA